MIIFMMTPENTWNPWNPVIKKKKSAKSRLPYSFLHKLAPSTTSAASSIFLRVSSLVNRVLWPASVISSVRIRMLGFALRPSFTSFTVNEGRLPSS